MPSLFHIKQINASYGNRHVLHDVSLDIYSQDRVLIIGPNGSGKTTLLKNMSGLILPKTGKIEYQGMDITHTSVKKRVNSGISFLLQKDNIAPGLTVEENFELAGFFIKKNKLKEQISIILDGMPLLKSKLKLRAGLLSGGERQALAIGMVIIKKPHVLLLDEPTAGLSPKAAIEIIDILKSVQKIFSIETICMVEHNLRLALAWASRVVIFVQGRVVFESDQPQNFINDPVSLEKYFFE